MPGVSSKGRLKVPSIAKKASCGTRISKLKEAIEKSPKYSQLLQIEYNGKILEFNKRFFNDGASGNKLELHPKVLKYHIKQKDGTDTDKTFSTTWAYVLIPVEGTAEEVQVDNRKDNNDIEDYANYY